ncbi:MAG TPA: ATP-binding protein [Actinomycetota bacterium]|jgi:signal transduction histidine kinase|nr:ATP-binding protein [Actinomycetota bacterium]
MSVPSMHVRETRPAPADIAAAVESLMLVERTKWAMRIHDGLTQSVTSAVLELQTLRQRIAADPVQAAAALAEIEAEIRKDLSEIREILFELDEGERREEPSLARFVDEVVQRWKLPARVVVEGDVDHVPAHVQEVAHRIIAEALANAAKHSGAPEVSLRLWAGAGELRIEVEDRGAGIGSGDLDADPHFGLRLMRARVLEIRGTLDIESTPGSGTRLVACLPVGE